MKTTYLFFICTLVLLVTGCRNSKSDPFEFELSKSTLDNVNDNGNSFTVDIISDYAWTAESSDRWCSLTPDEGTSGQALNISVEANLNTAERAATIVVTSNKIKKTITVTQRGRSSNIADYSYEIPVYFHVLYNSSAQNIPQSRIETMLTAVNRFYKDNNMKLTFKVAEIERTTAESASISCETFMKSKKGTTYYNLMKDPNRYINVFIYRFEENNTLGISHLPLTTDAHYLEGLTLVGRPVIEASQLSSIYCISLNTDYINEGANKYSPNDATVTFAHELGHYLGLYHAFTESESGELLNDCKDTDYCADTPSYNKTAYDAWLSTLQGSFTIDYLSQRQNCQGDSFTSTNIMDYAYSLANQFTNNQHERVRHVLNYSPLIPGPKIDQTRSRASSEETLEIPFRTIKCSEQTAYCKKLAFSK